jgi:hypothetical protein
MPLAPSVPRGRDERLHETQFAFGQVARITKAFAGGVLTMLGGPDNESS